MLRDDWYNLHKNDDSNPGFKKKWVNWWYYNKWYVVAAVVAIAMLIDLGHSIWLNRTNQPDFQIGYIGCVLPSDTAEHLEQSFKELAPDANGDGKVIVTFNEYALYGSPDAENPIPVDPAMNVAAQTRLSVDLQSHDSFLFLMLDPERFQSDSHALCRLDGSLPEETPDSSVPMYLPWKDFPVLAEMDLGTLSDPVLAASQPIENQTLLENLFVGRRYINPETDPEYAKACEEFWNILLAGTNLQ